MIDTENPSFIHQIRQVIKDAIDYLGSVLHLQQVRLLDYFITGFLFVVFLFIAVLLIVASFVLFNVAAGVWLANHVGGAGSLLILGVVYLLLGWMVVSVAASKLRRLK